MFGRKKKKEPKVEKLFDDAEAKNREGEGTENDGAEQKRELSDDDKLILGVGRDENEMSESQKRQMEQLGSVKDKISKILKSSNIEIVDENIGDEYESGGAEGDAKQQQDYDSLKALFGAADDKKSKELTLTIDDYDYTYTGQYLDEFDMVHVKGIKKIRLQNKYAKRIRKIALISSLVLFVAGAGVAAFFIFRKTPVYLKSISLNQLEGNYYVYDDFDYDGLYIIAEYSNGKKERIKLQPSHLVDKVGNIAVGSDGETLQFTGTIPATLTFSYGGKTVDYSVIVNNKRPSGLKAKYTEGLFKLNAGDSINSTNLKLLQKYSNFNPTYFDYDNSDVEIYINGTICQYDDQKKSFIASASTKPVTLGELSTATITVKSKDANAFTLQIKHLEDADGNFIFEVETQN